LPLSSYDLAYQKRVFPQYAAHCFGVSYGATDQIPKLFGVAELRQMAQLVDNDVVGKSRRQERDFVIKIEIAFARTAPPQRPLILDADFIKPQSVYPIEMRDTLMGKDSRIFFMLEKIPLRAAYDNSDRHAPKSLQFLHNPSRLARNKPLGNTRIHTPRQSHHYSRIPIHRQARPPRPRTHPQSIYDFLIPNPHPLLHI
jgi:hypothetical protein